MLLRGLQLTPIIKALVVSVDNKLLFLLITLPSMMPTVTRVSYIHYVSATVFPIIRCKKQCDEVMRLRCCFSRASASNSN